MSSFRWSSCLFALALIGCHTFGGGQTASGATTSAQASASSATQASAPAASQTSAATVAPASPAAKSDIVARGLNVTLGDGWYPYEIYQGVGFRWVDNDAEFTVHRPAGSLARLAIDAEPGPGFGLHARRFNLFVQAQNGLVVAKAPFIGRESVRFDLPVKPGRDATFTLHVVGGGKPIPTENRILNFRVFQIASASSAGMIGVGHPDIVAAGSNLRLGKNWYPLEQYRGETFRWVANDAQLIVRSESARERRLKLVAAAGPSIKSPANFTIALLDANGRELQAGKIKARGTLYLDLPLQAGTNTFALHTDSTGKRAPNDPRILDFRVFSLSVQ